MPLCLGGIKHALSLTFFTDFSFYGLTTLSPQSFHPATEMLRRKVAYLAASSEADQQIRKGNILDTTLSGRELSP